jgi:hypothetical protein
VFDFCICVNNLWFLAHRATRRVCVHLQLDWVTILLLVYIGHSAGLCGSSDLKKVKCSLPRASSVVRIVHRNYIVSGAASASEVGPSCLQWTIKQVK